MRIAAYIIILRPRQFLSSHLVNIILNEYFCCYFRIHYNTMSLAVCEDVISDPFVYYNRFTRSEMAEQCSVLIAETASIHQKQELIQKCIN